MASRAQDIQELLILGELAKPDRPRTVLDVLGRLAELYECRVADLVDDCADFRSADAALRDRDTLAGLSAIVGAESSTTQLTAAAKLADRMQSLDVTEVARLMRSWVDYLDIDLDGAGHC